MIQLIGTILCKMLQFMPRHVMIFKKLPLFFICVARGWGLTVSLIESKGVVAGIGANTSVLSPIVDLVESFKCLGSLSNDEEL